MGWSKKGLDIVGTRSPLETDSQDAATEGPPELLSDICVVPPGEESECDPHRLISPPPAGPGVSQDKTFRRWHRARPARRRPKISCQIAVFGHSQIWKPSLQFNLRLM